MQNKAKVQKAGRVNGGADGQKKTGREAKARPLQYEHGCKGRSCKAGLYVASGEEDSRRSEAK